MFFLHLSTLTNVVKFCDGAQTGDTRVSIDFRIAPGCCYNAVAAAALEDPKKPAECVGALGSYFSECRRDPQTGRFETTVRGYASHRHGFPHTNH